MPSIGVPFSSLPTSNGGRINSKLSGQLVLADTQNSAQLDDSFSETAAFLSKRDVPQELNNLGDQIKAWR